MSRLFSGLMTVCMLLMAAPASAGLVMPLDNFTLNTENGVVFSQGGFQVNRSVSFAPGMVGATKKFNASEGSFSMNGGTLTITYSIADNTQTFADLYSALTPEGYFLDGFSIGVRHVVPPVTASIAQYEILLNNSEAQAIPMGMGNTSLTSNFEWASAGAGNAISFTFRQILDNGPFSTVGSNFLEIGGPGTPGMSAVPEPSALLLVGSIIGFAGLRRRVRS